MARAPTAPVAKCIGQSNEKYSERVNMPSRISLNARKLNGKNAITPEIYAFITSFSNFTVYPSLDNFWIFYSLI